MCVDDINIAPPEAIDTSVYMTELFNTYSCVSMMHM